MVTLIKVTIKMRIQFNRLMAIFISIYYTPKIQSKEDMSITEISTVTDEIRHKTEIDYTYPAFVKKR